MTCARCRDSGRIADRVDSDPYGPIPKTTTLHGFCDCDAGAILTARDLALSAASFERHCAAIAYADAHVSPPPC